MSETPTTIGLYIPEPLLNAYRDLIDSETPTDIIVTISQTELSERAVNLWPTSPEIESLALAGAMRSKLRIQVTSIDTSAAFARGTGDRVRFLIAGRGTRGQLLHRPTADGFTVIDAVASEGRSDEQGGIGQWTEVFEVLYDVSDAVGVAS